MAMLFILVTMQFLRNMEQQHVEISMNMLLQAIRWQKPQLTDWELHKMVAILKRTLSNAFLSMKISQIRIDFIET